MQDLINRIVALRERLQTAWGLLKIDEKKQEVISLQNEMSVPGFWDNQEKASAIARRASDLETEVDSWGKTKRSITDLLEITELDKDDQTISLRADVEKQIESLEALFAQEEFKLLFSGPYDAEDAIVAIHAGAGGTDAQDWAEMLLRMYLRFCEKQGWKTEIINTSYGGEAGIKSVLFEVTGRHAYGYLKSEAGVHRLVRISPFDAEKMRHTSFALVEVLPYLPDSVEIDIKTDDLRIDTFRSSGKGGQSVNTTDSAVRITHLPTGIVVSCQNERSQAQNKERALRVLKAKLQQYYQTEVEEERARLRGEYTEAAWGNQARSYVIHPYKLVKDHRTDFEATNVDEVLDGALLPFMESYLRSQIK